LEHIKMYDEIVELRNWARVEFDSGNRTKASRLMKVAERLTIRIFGIPSRVYRCLFQKNN
jgi:hypothetical protein